jgi:ATP-dependent Clp endopeptidase proteolytic subunit ClpP
MDLTTSQKTRNLTSKMKTWYNIKAKEDDEGKYAVVSIHDEIGAWGIRASQFMADLRALGDVSRIELSIHSPGGDVLDGWAIYNSIKRSSAHVKARVEGLAASMASVILMAADEIEIPENAFVMIHEPWGFAMGDAEEMRETAELLEKMAGGIVSAYTERTGQPEEDVRSLMKKETWMTGEEAVNLGFADKVLAKTQIAAKIRTTRFKHMPTSLSVSTSADEPIVATVEADKAPVAEETKPGLIDRAFAALGGGKVEADYKAKLDEANGKIAALEAKVADLEPKAREFESLQARVVEIEAHAAQRIEEAKATVQAEAAKIAAQAGFAPDTENTLPQASVEESTNDWQRFQNATPEERADMAKDPVLWAKIRAQAAFTS